MDILKLIRSQIDHITKNDELNGLKSVLTHIERAEYFLSQGLDTQDEAFFTDAIYRTNQAFEGVLKEAYSVLANKKGTKNLTPYKIEKYFTDNDIFRERVLDQFTSYRQNWRNPSTHDHKLSFNHSESFLAIISVSAFIHVLLNQMAERIAYNKESDKLKQENKNITGDIKEYQEVKAVMKLALILEQFANETPELLTTNSDYEIIGMMEAYIKNADASFKTETEPKIHDLLDNTFRPDLMVSDNKDSIIIEVKRFSSNRSIENGISQLMSYMTMVKITNGILFIPPTDESNGMLVSTKKIALDYYDYTVIKVVPK